MINNQVAAIGQLAAQGNENNTLVITIGAIITLLPIVGGGIAWLIKHYFDRKERSDKFRLENEANALTEYKNLLSTEREEREQDRIAFQKEREQMKAELIEYKGLSAIEMAEYKAITSREFAELKRDSNAKINELLRKFERSQIEKEELARRTYRAERGSIEAQRRISSLVISGRSALIIATSDGIILRASLEVVNIFHYLPEELEGQPVEILMPKDVRTQHNNAVQKAITTNMRPIGAKRVDTVALTKEGRRINITNLVSWFKADDNGSYLMSAEIYSPPLNEKKFINTQDTDEGPMKGLEKLPE